MPDPDDLTEPQAAAALRVAGETLARWRRAGCGPAYSRTPTGRIRYQWSDLLAFRSIMRVSPQVVDRCDKSGEEDAGSR